MLASPKGTLARRRASIRRRPTRSRSCGAELGKSRAPGGRGRHGGRLVRPDASGARDGRGRADDRAGGGGHAARACRPRPRSSRSTTATGSILRARARALRAPRPRARALARAARRSSRRSSPPGSSTSSSSRCRRCSRDARARRASRSSTASSCLPDVRVAGDLVSIRRHDEPPVPAVPPYFSSSFSAAELMQ